MHIVLLSIINWSKTFYPDRSVVEVILRGTVVFLAIYLLLRFVLRRQAGTLGISDVLVLVLLGDAAQNSMTAGYTTVTDGLALIGTIVFWAFAVDWLGYHVRALRWLTNPPKLAIVRDGCILWRNMRRELITEDELMTQIRLQGIDDLARVKVVYVEGDGGISVIERDDGISKSQGARERSVT